MRRLTLRLAVAVLTFAAGTGASAVYFLRRAPEPHVAPVELIVGASVDEAVTPSCFPGRAVPLAETEGRGRWRYFPRGSFDPKPEREKFLVEWYEKYLAAMGESALSVRREEPAEVYRFLWLRSFHNPMAVRVWRTSEGRFISVKELRFKSFGDNEDADDYKLGKLIADDTRPLRAEEWDEFTRLLEGACYWNLAARRDTDGEDGARWILEGARDGRYHVVDEWTPQSGAYREACLHLLKLSGLIDVSGKYVY